MIMKKLALFAILFCMVLYLTPASAQAEDGAALFKTKCASCHGPDGAGQTAVGKSMKLRHLGSAEVQVKSDADLQLMIAEGGKDKKAMHQFAKKGLTPEQIKALVAFVRTLKK
jgi:cytochrome c6